MQSEYVKIEIFYLRLYGFLLIMDTIDGIVTLWICMLLARLHATYFSERASQGLRRFGWRTNGQYVRSITGFNDYLTSSFAIFRSSSKKSVTLFLWTSFHVFSSRAGVRHGTFCSMALRLASRMRIMISRRMPPVAC